MLSRYFSLFNLLCFILISCHSATDDNGAFYPIDSFFNNEVKQIDSLPIAIFHIKTENGKSDTSIIDKKSFREMAEGLFMNEMNGFTQKKEFTETILQDVQLNETTITYTDSKKTTGLLKIELHIQNGETGLKSVYMERNDVFNRQNRIRKMLWMTGKSLSVQSYTYSNQVVSENRTDKFIWEMIND